MKSRNCRLVQGSDWPIRARLHAFVLSLLQPNATWLPIRAAQRSQHRQNLILRVRKKKRYSQSFSFWRRRICLWVSEVFYRKNELDFFQIYHTINGIRSLRKRVSSQTVSSQTSSVDSQTHPSRFANVIWINENQQKRITLLLIIINDELIAWLDWSTITNRFIEQNVPISRWLYSHE